MPAEDRRTLAEELVSVAEVVWLFRDGSPISLQECPDQPIDDLTTADWVEGLTAMRNTMLSCTAARVVLGGRVEGYSGAMPGIAEETRLALEAGQPLYLLGGFGGCARDIAESLELATLWQSSTRDWDGRKWFDEFGCADLNNGLTLEENGALANTPHIDEAVVLALMGLERIKPSMVREC